MIHIHSIPSQFLLPSPLKPKYITPPNETVTCVCADLTTLYGKTLLCVWIVINLFYLTTLYLYMCALNDSSISVDCTNILLLIEIF